MPRRCQGEGPPGRTAGRCVSRCLRSHLELQEGHPCSRGSLSISLTRREEPANGFFTPDRATAWDSPLVSGLFGRIRLLRNQGQNRELWAVRWRPVAVWHPPTQVLQCHCRKCPHDPEERRQVSLPCPSGSGQRDTPAPTQWDTPGSLDTAHKWSCPKAKIRDTCYSRSIRWPHVPK